MNDRYDPDFINIYDDSEQSYKNQKEILESEKQIVDKNKIKHKKNKLEWYNSVDERDDRFDPLLNNLYKTGGDKDDSDISLQVLYLDVNSSFRSKIPKLIVEKEVLLDDNPITFANGSTNLVFSYPDHNLEVGDRLSISGIKTSPIKLRTKVGASQTLEFTNNSRYLAINFEHNIPLHYEDTYIKIDIDGVRGEDGDNSIGNIDVNYINSSHIVYLIKPQESKVPEAVFNTLKFYIELPRTFSGTYTPSTYNFTIKFNSLYGVPINLINAGYPVTIDNNVGLHTITSITNDSFTINVKKSALTGGINMTGGGSSVVVNKINKIIDGYSNPNFYSIPFPKVINNVVSIGLVSSEFPYSIKTFTSINNRLYWQNVEDGDTLYSISITPGNYTSSQLINEIRKRSIEIPRNLSDESVYENSHLIDTTIEDTTGRVEFINYKTAILSNPIDSVIPQIQTSTSLDNFDDDTKFVLTFSHEGHGLRVGDTIVVSGALEHLGISADHINKMHFIESVESDDSYTIRLPKINLSDIRNNTGGGNAVRILVPSLFKMRFDLGDTCGTLLGFRSVGESYAITPYATKITNYDLYEQDITTDENGNSIDVINNELRLYGYDYFLMEIQNVSNMLSLGPEKDVFAKILLNGTFGKTIYNSFVNAKKIYPIPLNKLEELFFRFYLPDGKLVDFGGLDHSFTLEIKYLRETPKGTNIPNTTSRFIKQEDIVALDYY